MGSEGEGQQSAPGPARSEELPGVLPTAKQRWFFPGEGQMPLAASEEFHLKSWLLSDYEQLEVLTLGLF